MDTVCVWQGEVHYPRGGDTATGPAHRPTPNARHARGYGTPGHRPDEGQEEGYSSQFGLGQSAVLFHWSFGQCTTTRHRRYPRDFIRKGRDTTKADNSSGRAAETVESATRRGFLHRTSKTAPTANFGRCGWNKRFRADKTTGAYSRISGWTVEK